MKYFYYSQKEFESFRIGNKLNSSNYNQRPRTFVKDVEFTYSASGSEFPSRFDDYRLVHESVEYVEIILGDPY